MSAQTKTARIKMIPPDPSLGVSEALRAHAESLNTTRSLTETMLERARNDAAAAYSLNDLSRRISASAGIADAVGRLLPNYRPPRSAFQQMAEDAINNARFSQSLETMATRIGTAAGSLNLTRELLRSFEPPRSSIQQMIDAAQANMARGTVADILGQALNDSRTARMHLDPVSETIRRAVTSNQLWQSQRTADFFERLVREPEFRGAFLEEFDAEEQEEAQPTASEIPIQTVLDAVESGLGEVVGNHGPRSTEASVRSMFSHWRALPEELRSLVINVIAGIITLYLGLFLLPASTSNNYISVAPQQQVRMVQRVIENVIINNGFSADVHRQLRVVKRDRLPVYLATRRDSPKVATLPRARVVMIVSQRRHWTKVSWSENEGRETHVGWVHTRYLKKAGPR